MKAVLQASSPEEFRELVVRIEQVLANPKYNVPFAERLIEITKEGNTILDVKKSSPPKEKSRRRAASPYGYQKRQQVV